jgi:hypothetical protein
MINGITDNVVSWIIELHLGSFSKSHQLGSWLVPWKTEFDLMLSFIDLLGSNLVWPKEILLSGDYCTKQIDAK